MLYRIAADAVVLVHFAFIVFVAVGALLAWRWPRLVWLHLPALAWGIATVLIGVDCPLTGLEKGLRRRAGTAGYEGGFVDHYIEDVVYPDEYTGMLRALAAVIIVTGYLGLRRRSQRSMDISGPDPGIPAPGGDGTAPANDSAGWRGDGQRVGVATSTSPSTRSRHLSGDARGLANGDEHVQGVDLCGNPSDIPG